MDLQIANFRYYKFLNDLTGNKKSIYKVALFCLSLLSNILKRKYSKIIPSTSLLPVPGSKN